MLLALRTTSLPDRRRKIPDRWIQVHTISGMRAVLSKLECVQESPEDVVKLQFCFREPRMGPKIPHFQLPLGDAVTIDPWHTLCKRTCRGKLRSCGSSEEVPTSLWGVFGEGGTWWVLVGKTQGRKVEKVYQVKKHHLWSPSGEELQIREGQGEHGWRTGFEPAEPDSRNPDINQTKLFPSRTPTLSHRRGRAKGRPVSSYVLVLSWR